MRVNIHKFYRSREAVIKGAALLLYGRSAVDPVRFQPAEH